MIEVQADIFTFDDLVYTYAHCISEDLKMGAGIAVPIKKKFNLGAMADQYQHLGPADYFEAPTCVLFHGVLNLITKKYFWNKPTYEDMKNTLLKMKQVVEHYKIYKVIMPRIGCGLDKLNWKRVKLIIEEVFENVDIEITVCYL